MREEVRKRSGRGKEEVRKRLEKRLEKRSGSGQEEVLLQLLIWRVRIEVSD